MTTATIASAMQRVRVKLSQRPEGALHTDEPAVARWENGLRVLAQHANGARVATDMPRALGGNGDEVTPGWLLRAALASCLATRIVMEAATREIALARLEVVATSQSDARGLFGMPDDTGAPVSAGPCAVQLQVRLGAPEVPAEVLRAMIEESSRCSPVQCALEGAIPVSLRIDIDIDSG